MNVKTIFVATAKTAQLQVGLLACFSFRSSQSRGLQTRPRFLLHHRRGQPTQSFFWRTRRPMRCFATGVCGGGKKNERWLQMLTKVPEKFAYGVGSWGK
jgi:hypothetical protein